MAHPSLVASYFEQTAVLAPLSLRMRRKPVVSVGSLAPHFASVLAWKKRTRMDLSLPSLVLMIYVFSHSCTADDGEFGGKNYCASGQCLHCNRHLVLRTITTLLVYLAVAFESLHWTIVMILLQRYRPSWYLKGPYGCIVSIVSGRW